MNDTFTSMYVTGQHKNKQISDRLEYITHLHQHTWSIHNSYVSKMCIQNIANIFAGFWIRACWKTAKSAKINVPRIFPRLQIILCIFFLYVFKVYFSNIDSDTAEILKKGDFEFGRGRRTLLWFEIWRLDTSSEGLSFSRMPNMQGYIVSVLCKKPHESNIVLTDV